MARKPASKAIDHTPAPVNPLEPGLVVLGEAMPYLGSGGGGDGATRTIEIGRFLQSKYTAPKLIHEAAKRARDFTEKHWWIRTMLRLKMGFFFKGVRVVGATEKQREWLKKNRRLSKVTAFADDMAREFASMGNAAAVWTKWAKAPWRQPIEDIRAAGMAMGEQHMTIMLKGQGEKPQGLSLPAHWDKVWVAGGEVKLDREAGDDFRFVTDGFSDAGLVQPALMTALALFCTLEFLNKADWTGAFAHGDVIRQIRKGYLLPGGAANNSGETAKTLSPAARKKLKDEAAKKKGGQDWITQHDLEILFKYLEPSYFDATKYDGVMKHLQVWAGSVAEIQDDKSSQYLLTQMRAEADEVRRKVKQIVGDVLNDSPLLDSRGRPPGDLEIGWDNTPLWDAKTLVETARFLVGQGAMSVTTLREWFSLDDTLEGDRLKAELKDPERYRPGFEPKQGMMTDGPNGGNGRPQEKPNDKQTTQT